MANIQREERRIRQSFSDKLGRLQIFDNVVNIPLSEKERKIVNEITKLIKTLQNLTNS